MKKLVVKMIAVLGLLCLADFVHQHFFLENDLRRFSPLAMEINRIDPNTDVLYIGESSNTTFRGDDANKSSISMFIGEHLKDVRIAGITQPAGHAGTFKNIIQYSAKRLKPKIVVVTLNLRSFDAAWLNSRLEPSLNESLVLMRDCPTIINRIMLSFKDYSIQTPAESDELLNQMWSQPFHTLPKDFPYKSALDWEKGILSDVNRYKNDNDRALALHYIKAYAFEIDTLTHQRIADLDEIVMLANEFGFNLCFNLMAENCVKAEDLVGMELVDLMNQNKKILIDRYRRKGVLVVDNFSIVPDSEFVDQNWTTEHYAEIGRRLIAKAVAKSLAEEFQLVFSESNSKYDSTQTRFSNDCEGSVVWGGGDSLTDEESFSGLFCSKTGGEIPYGLTFEFPINLLPISRTENVEFSFVFKGEKPEFSGAVLQTSGDNPFFTMLPFHGSKFNLKEWNQANVSFPINDQIRSGKTIKLFIYTNNDTQLFADDFLVEFK